MLKQIHSTSAAQKRRTQVALDLPLVVEQHLRSGAANEFRSLGKEIAMRLVQSVRQEAQQLQGTQA